MDPEIKRSQDAFNMTFHFQVRSNGEVDRRLETRFVGQS